MPFPPLLKWTLLGSIAIFGLLALIGLIMPNARTLGGWLVSVALLMQLVAVPVAIWFLRRIDYRTGANIAMTVVAGVPWLFIALGLISIFTGLTKFHI